MAKMIKIEYYRDKKGKLRTRRVDGRRITFRKRSSTSISNRRRRILPKVKKKMEEDFGSNVNLEDDLFNALNNLDSGIGGERKSNYFLPLKNESDVLVSNNPDMTSLSNIQPNLNFDFTNMSLLSDDKNAIDEFLNFNTNDRNLDDNIMCNSKNEEPFMNLNLFDDYPRIDLNSLIVEKPIDVIVGLPDNSLVYESYDNKDNNKSKFEDQTKLKTIDFDEKVHFEMLRTKEQSNTSIGNVLSTLHGIQDPDESFPNSHNLLSQLNYLPQNLVYSENQETFVSPVEYKAKRKLNLIEIGSNSEENVSPDGGSKSSDASKKFLFDKENSHHYIRYQNCGDRNVKIWQCGICGKDFRHQYTLTRHLPTHTDERNYKCDTCGKAFRQMSTLSQHRAIHSDARPYICEFCHKSFNRVSTLISHKKTHSDSKPHQCNICGKAFHQKGNLRNHIFTHTNERPYKCELCNKGFNQMSNLMCHKAHAHSKKMYACVLCSDVFSKRLSLRTHEECIHGIKYSNKEFYDRKNVDYMDEHVSDEESGHLTKNVFQNLKVTKTSDDSDSAKNKTVVAGVCIDLIKTKAMETAKRKGQTPFALLKPSSGIPVLVKILNANNNTRHMLVPATAGDLKSAGKITVSSSEDTTNVKAVQIKVPVVATVVQTFDSDGKMEIKIEPPGPEAENEVQEVKTAVKVEPDLYCETSNLSEDGKDNYHVLNVESLFKKLYNDKNDNETFSSDGNNMASIFTAAV